MRSWTRGFAFSPGFGQGPRRLSSLVAADEVEANFFVNMAQMLRGYHETQGQLTGITRVGNLTVAQAKTGQAIIPFPLDYGVWTVNADRLS